MRLLLVDQQLARHLQILLLLVEHFDPGLGRLDIAAELFHEIGQRAARLQLDVIDAGLVGEIVETFADFLQRLDFLAQQKIKQRHQHEISAASALPGTASGSGRPKLGFEVTEAHETHVLLIGKHRRVRFDEADVFAGRSARAGRASSSVRPISAGGTMTPGRVISPRTLPSMATTAP